MTVTRILALLYNGLLAVLALTRFPDGYGISTSGNILLLLALPSVVCLLFPRNWLRPIAILSCLIQVASVVTHFPLNNLMAWALFAGPYVTMWAVCDLCEKRTKRLALLSGQNVA